MMGILTALAFLEDELAQAGITMPVALVFNNDDYCTIKKSIPAQHVVYDVSGGKVVFKINGVEIRRA